jgi:hypothetical protein
MQRFIVVTRNPSSKKLVILVDEDDNPVEFDMEDAASEAADDNACCRAWGADIATFDI